MRKSNPYIRPKNKDFMKMNQNFFEYQLLSQYRQAGGIAGCIQMIRNMRSKDKSRISNLEQIKEDWDMNLKMEEDLHNEITENSTKCYAVYLSQKTSENYIQNLYFLLSISR